MHAASTCARDRQFASEADMIAMSAPGVRLITAASDGDKKGVRRWLEQGVDVDSRDWDNLTPLIAASSQGHLVRKQRYVSHHEGSLAKHNP